MKVKRISEYSPLERLVIKEIYGCVKHVSKDGNVRTLTSRFTHQNERYDIECDFLLTSDYLQIIKLDVKHNQSTIITNSDIRIGKPIYKEIYIDE